MKGYHFDLDPCCAPWEHLDSTRVAQGTVRARVRCQGCGQVRVVTVTSRREVVA